MNAQRGTRRLYLEYNRKWDSDERIGGCETGILLSITHQEEPPEQHEAINGEYWDNTTKIRLQWHLIQIALGHAKPGLKATHWRTKARWRTGKVRRELRRQRERTVDHSVAWLEVIVKDGLDSSVVEEERDYDGLVGNEYQSLIDHQIVSALSWKASRCPKTQLGLEK